MTPLPRWYRWSRTSALALALVLPVALPMAAAHANPLDATRVTLANGLRVVLSPDPALGTVDATLWYRGGTRHETTAQAGVSQLAARLTFRNGANDPLAPLEAEGGNGQLAVTPDLTSLSATVPAEALGAALDFLAARLPGAAVSAPQLAAERAAVRAERAVPSRTAVVRALARLWGASWPGHPYARTGSPPAAGDALTVADIEAWKKARFTPANAVLTITGTFDPDKALADVRAKFEAKPKGTAPAVTAAPVPKAAQRASDRIDSPARLCLVGWRAPGAGDPDAPALELLASCLGGGSESRLSTTLVRDWNLAVTAQAGFAAQREGSLLWTLAVVPPGADSAAVERTLIDAAKSVSLKAPEAFELERARRQLEAAVWFGLQTSRQRGEALGEAELQAGDAAAAVKRLEALDQVTPADLKRVAARIMTDAGRATVWMLPTPEAASR
jgi:zinc protease